MHLLCEQVSEDIQHLAIAPSKQAKKKKRLEIYVIELDT